MYSTCLFCNRHLGSNEALEHFQVGRRLAYDEAKGRLWVVCAGCERWNLTPLETRWEAIEEAERAFRASPLRASTDNIGLAQLSEGLQLVRVGKPPQLELAGWRYGDQFGKRRRKHVMIGAAATLGGAGIVAGGAAVVISGVVSMTLLSSAFQLFQFANLWFLRNPRIAVKARIRTDDGSELALSSHLLRGAALVPERSSGTWHLKVAAYDGLPQGDRSGWRPVKVAMDVVPNMVVLKGDTAYRALSTILPHVNRAGGSAREVRDAVGDIASASSLDALLYSASTRRQYTNNMPGENLVAGLPSRLRLALEMTLHDSDERRALEGEMAELEQRWREAEEIAAIADSLLVPADLEDRLSALRKRLGQAKGLQ